MLIRPEVHHSTATAAVGEVGSMPVLSVSSKYGWLPRARSYEEERAELERAATPVDEADLPLQEEEEKAADAGETSTSVHATLTQSSAVVDPLSGDPLSAAAQLEGESLAAAPPPPGHCHPF